MTAKRQKPPSERAIGDERHEFGSFFLSRLLGIEVAYEGDECVACFEAAPQLFNPQGSVHGGVMATALDISMGHLLKHRFGAGSTLEMKLQYFAPVENRDCPLPRQLPEEGTQDLLSAIIRVRRRRRNHRARDLDLEADLRPRRRRNQGFVTRRVVNSHSAGLACNHGHGAGAVIGLKHPQLNQNHRVGHAAAPVLGSSLDPFSSGPYSALRRYSNQGLPSRDIFDHQSAARPSLDGAQLRKPTPVQTAVLADAAAAATCWFRRKPARAKPSPTAWPSQDLLGDAERFERAAAPLALIVAPTRELALQVHRELAWLYQYADARVVSCVGGMDPRREQRELAEGAHIVVGTPGRLCDHLRRGRLDVSELKAVVLDEADEMLDLGFREDMEFILKTTPETRRTLLFSATLPRGIVALAKQYQQQAFRVEVAGDEGGHADIEYRTIRIAAGDVEHARRQCIALFRSRRARWCFAIPERRSGICRRHCWSAGSPWSRSRAN